jgi:hypothetical protein
VDPKLVLVFELSQGVDPDEFRRAGLRVLDSSDAGVVVAFADDPQLEAFLSRVERYQAGPIEIEKRPSYEGFIGAITELRTPSFEDRLSARLRTALAASAGEIRLDLELWHPGESETAERWLAELGTVVVAAGGVITDSVRRDDLGLLLARAALPADRVPDLAILDQLALLDLVPSIGITPEQAADVRVDNLPRFAPPFADAPIVAVIDSGVASAHPLLAGAIRDETSLSPGIPDSGDEAGHGTHITSLLLHGPIERLIGIEETARPPCSVISIRVLDAKNLFPKGERWETTVERAVRHAVGLGARIIILAIGDPDTPYQGPRTTPLAAVLDSLIRELGVVILVPTGNVDTLPALLGGDRDRAQEYVNHLPDRADTRIIDPAPAALALTIGGVCISRGADAIDSIARESVGQADWPSPISRHGPGIGESVKPDMSAASGSVAFDLDRNDVVDDDRVRTLGAIPPELGRLLGFDAGTSFAVPLVARAAARTLERYPAASALLIRALLLQSVRPSPIEQALDGTEAQKRELLLRTIGYGIVDEVKAVDSGPYRVVLCAEASIPANGVHVYSVPVPASFFDSGGIRQVSVALAFSPPARVHRLDYLGSRMEFHLIRGDDPAVIESLLLSVDPTELEQIEDENGESDDEQDAASGGVRLQDVVLAMSPGPRARSRGANQYARRVLRQKLKDNRYPGRQMFLAVKNTAYWQDEDELLDYALTVSLERDDGHAEIYAELEGRVEAPVEVRLEV